MDIQEFLMSGAVESYVLGLSDPAEMREMEILSAHHAEIRQAIAAFELQLEQDALNSAVAPPAALKDKVMEALQKEGMKLYTTQPQTAAPVAKVVSLEAPKSVRWLRGAIAACIILLIGSAMLNFYYYSQYRKFNNQYTELLAKQNVLMADNKVMQASFKTITDTAMVQVPMKAPTADKAGSMATILWDSRTKDVFLMVNHLPTPVAGKQYQLWAIVDGKPVDAGMVDMNVQSGLIKMHNIPSAQAFAITLEKAGGSPTPTMEEMYVLGKV